MAKTNENPAITPEQSLDSLPLLEYEPESLDETSELGRVDLMQSVLLIAGLDHVAESRLVRDVVRNALGHAPEPEE